jgi:hypothetical protein
MRKKYVLIYEISNFIPIPRNMAEFVDLFLTPFLSVRILQSQHTNIFTILTPRVYYSALLPRHWISLHTYTSKFYAGMQSTSFKHIRLLLLQAVPKEETVTNSSHVAYNQG